MKDYTKAKLQSDNKINEKTQIINFTSQISHGHNFCKK
jgi:hypothetical protein